MAVLYPAPGLDVLISIVSMAISPVLAAHVVRLDCLKYATLMKTAFVGLTVLHLQMIVWYTGTIVCY
jgi:hypothetical protein